MMMCQSLLFFLALLIITQKKTLTQTNIIYIYEKKKRIKIDWPSKEREHKFQKQQRLNILQSLLDSATLSHIFNMTTQLMAIDVIANLADILSPKLSNPSKMSNLSDKEKQALEDVAKSIF